MPEIEIVENILSVNDQLALNTQKDLDGLHVLGLNVMASPGGGKTSVIYKTIEALKDEYRVGVMEGDVVMIDVDKIAQLGVPVELVNTGGDCHLDANMVREVLPKMGLDKLDLMIIENVGNLICPAAFKLGTHLNVLIASVPEGADKPYKYPNMYRGADVLLLNKMDLKDYMEFDLDYFRRGVEILNPGVAFFPISCRTGDGLAAWLDWLRAKIQEHKA
ncbi:MAG TPA: hydrogenase nickel incorporation protein HypB [Aggregatilineaceae bacterium]|nr:hydrogenase nickel incorporation protein HypB [Aggregatilineaceae bacterium]